MFRHEGKGRTYSHNLKLASILSTVAGIVNISSVLELGTLTTNVTGHFAFFSEELVLKDYSISITYLFYILCFLLGAFASSFIMEWVSKRSQQSTYMVPISIEVLILVSVSFSGWLLPGENADYSILLSAMLLFAMGLQNALVTRVSRSVVRTTHLTGLFTDLGIELSRLLFHREQDERRENAKSILLKLAIIGCFFIGGILGGYLLPFWGLRTLLIPASLLVFALWYDSLLFKFYKIKRRLRA
jgi:uncharacterized membrane protein YoaK (UPF0700 family)